jgi:hypothetical protein
MSQVIIGVDPHKLSATIEVVDHDERLLGSGRFTTDQAGYAAMRSYAKAWPDRVWAVEGANGPHRPSARCSWGLCSRRGGLHRLGLCISCEPALVSRGGTSRWGCLQVHMCSGSHSWRSPRCSLSDAGSISGSSIQPISAHRRGMGQRPILSPHLTDLTSTGLRSRDCSCSIRRSGRRALFRGVHW